MWFSSNKFQIGSNPAHKVKELKFLWSDQNVTDESVRVGNFQYKFYVITCVAKAYLYADENRRFVVEQSTYNGFWSWGGAERYPLPERYMQRLYEVNGDMDEDALRAHIRDSQPCVTQKGANTQALFEAYYG